MWGLLLVCCAATVAVAGTAAARRSGSEPTPSAAELQARLNAAITARAAAFTIPPGAYNFSQANFNITGASGLRLTAAGVAVWFDGTSGINLTNCDDVHLIGPLSINYTTMPHGRRGVPGITYNLLNCSDIVSEDVTIWRAPFFSVTAFNGGGGHVFRRFRLPNSTSGERWPHQRDAFHFTDLRRGVVVEDSVGGYCGDDFFNAHNTAMLVLRRESPSTLLLSNPHLQNVAKGRNTVYGTNCVLENVRAGDEMSFFAFPPAGSFTPVALGDGPFAILASPEGALNASVLADAAALAKKVATDHGTISFDASDVWRVRFTSPLPPAVVRGVLVNIDSFSTPGTQIRNNTFTVSKYNLGRFKSNGGVIVNNTFSGAGVHNLEICPLLQYFEGPLPRTHSVLVSGNTITGEGSEPIHCSPLCSSACPPGACANCSACATDSPWAENITVVDNHIHP